MKRHVQLEGVRKWAGDHLLELEGQPLEVLDRFFGQYGSYVLTGCEVTPAADEIAAADGLVDVAPGLVVLAGVDAGGADAVMVVPFEGVVGVPLPVYLTLAWNTRLGEYVTGGEKPIAYDYYATASTVEPAEGTAYLLFDADTPRFVDVIQDATHSFITEAERVRWNGKASMEWVLEYLANYDPTAIGELRQMYYDRSLDGNEKYLLCNGSEIDIEDYPDLQLPVGFIRSTALPQPSTSATSSVMVCSDESPGTIIFVANSSSGNSTAYISTDWGATWSTGKPLKSAANPFICISVAEDRGTLFLLGQRNGAVSNLFLSKDNGETWTQKISAGIANSDLRYLAKSSDGRLVAAGYNALWSSLDGGETWTENTTFRTSSILWAGFVNGRFFIAVQSPSKSWWYSDDLITWTQCLTVTTAIYDGRIIPVGGSTLITTSYNAVWRSVDNGTTWSQVYTSTWANTQSNVLFCDGVLILTGGQIRAIWRSEDLGTTWSSNSTLENAGSQIVVLSTLHGIRSCILIAGNGGPKNTNYISTDNGITWQIADARLNGSNYSFLAGDIVRMIGQRAVARQSNSDKIYYNNPWGTLPDLTESDTHTYIRSLK